MTAVSIGESVAIARKALVLMRKRLPNRAHAARPGICGGTKGRVNGSAAVVMFHRDDNGTVYMVIHKGDGMKGERRFSLPRDVQADAGKVLDALE